MQLPARLLLCAVTSLFSLQLFAQEGYPLDGTWRGYRGVQGQDGILAVLVMSWDGEQISGRINPGRNSIPFTSATLDAAQWFVQIEATSREGEAISITGVLGNIGSYNRTITGSWTQGGMSWPVTFNRE